MEDLTELQARLDRAQAHVEKGLGHLAKHTRLIADGLARGKDVAQLHELFETLEETQRLHVWDRDRLRSELDQALAGNRRWTV